jgi:ABC-type polar amino acid transport system ATPase subunit
MPMDPGQAVREAQELLQAELHKVRAEVRAAMFAFALFPCYRALLTLTPALVAARRAQRNELARQRAELMQERAALREARASLEREVSLFSPPTPNTPSP